ncbi:MAG TPA: NAD-dependent deacylase [Gemmatimonadaceae bacterium]|nr:NAD-dependent deacylase [Gemmatimonadaceae bacterium]
MRIDQCIALLDRPGPTDVLLGEMNRIIERLRAAARVVVFTGAGISAESGIPTFRDAQTGVWARFSPEELASPEGFRRDPTKVWEWYRWRRELVDRAVPNAGHYAITELQRQIPNTVVITQNVDGLHQAAQSRDVIELHGSLQRACCPSCTRVRRWELADPFPPTCACGAMMRPDVVWFGERLPQATLERAFDASAECQVFFSVGTSNLVHPAASLPWVAARRGALVVIVNVSMEGQETGDNIERLTGPAGVVLPQLVKLAFPTPL